MWLQKGPPSGPFPPDRRTRIDEPICAWLLVPCSGVDLEKRSMRNAAESVLGTLLSKQLPPVSTWDRAAAANRRPPVAFFRRWLLGLTGR